MTILEKESKEEIVLRQLLHTLKLTISQYHAYTALGNIGIQHAGFFLQAQKTFKYAMFSNAMKVCDVHPKAASLRFLRNYDAAVFLAALKEAQLDEANLSEFSDKLKHIRVKTHVHHDQEYVGIPNRPWIEKEITDKEFGDTIQKLWKVLNIILREKFSGQFVSEDIYRAEDVPKIIDAARKDKIQI